MPTTATTTQSPPQSRYTVGRIARGVWKRTRTYAQGIASVIPKLAYGNSAGFHHNYSALRELKRIQQATPVAPALFAESPYVAHAHALQSDGYVLFRSRHDPGLLRAIRESYTTLITDPQQSVSSPNGATRFLVDPLASVPALGELLTEEITRTIASYYRCALRVASVRAWRNHHVPNRDPNREDVFSNTFHHDNTPVTGLRVFVLLCDAVTRETGAFRFHDKRNSRSIVRSPGYFHRFAMPASMRRRLVDAGSLKFFEGDMGDACICNTQECLHAASIPKAGTYRDIVQFEIGPTSGAYVAGRELLRNVPPDPEIAKMVRG